MISIADGSVCIQTSSASVGATPSWFGKVVLLTAHLRKHGVLNKINEQARFARRRFGHYDVIDFLAVLFGYAISGECTLESLVELLQPFAIPFMALFERGEVVRTRTTVSQAHSSQWLGTFGNRGNGRYREELRKGLSAIGRYLTIHHLPQGGHASCRKEEESGRRHTCAYSSTNCSSRTCRNTPSPPSMWSSCICIAEPYGSLRVRGLGLLSSPARFFHHETLGSNCLMS